LEESGKWQLFLKLFFYSLVAGFMFFWFLWLLEAMEEKFGVVLPHWTLVISLGSVVGMIIGGVNKSVSLLQENLGCCFLFLFLLGMDFAT
jgi:H+/gluconate symporter-like permease